MTRKSLPTIAVAGSAVFLLILSYLLSPAVVRVQAAGLPGLHVSGSRLLDVNGKQVILRGVNRSGTEYACIQGWGIFDGPNATNDDASIPPMKTWGINGVNVGLNEDCWLGINGVPSAYGGINYQNAIVHYVQTIEANGMYPVLSLFWEGSGTNQATDQIAMPDADHATAFWQSVANTFKNDTAVIFRLKEEPYPAGNSDTTAAWKCWRDGGSACNEGYATVGMQSLVNTIRATGATNVIQVPGIQYANTMTQFLTYKPSDSLNNLMAVVDVYPDMNPCGNTTCYNTYYAPIINQMPFMAGEFGESVNGNICGTSNSDTLMNWLDAHNSGYFAWTWDTWGTTCGDLSLILSYDGTPKSPNGTDYRSHLLALAGAATPTPTTVPTVGSTATPTATKPPSTSTPTATAVTAPTATPTCVKRHNHCA